MLHIFAGPTPYSDATQRLAVPASPDADWAGPRPVLQHAGELQGALAAELGAIEHRAHIQYTQQGVMALGLVTETPAGRYHRRMLRNGLERKVIERLYPFDPARDPFDDEPLEVSITGRAPAPMEFRRCASEKLNDLAADYIDESWFPDGWDFGNGVSTNVWVPCRDGKLYLVSWCVWHPDAAPLLLADAGAQRACCQVMEGN